MSSTIAPPADARAADSASHGDRPSWPRRNLPTLILAAVIYIPLLLTKPGKVGADTKSYLYLDPGRMLGRAASMWDPNIGLGTVTHQNIGFLWPIGPYYWLMDAIGAPDWVAQRIWTASIMFLAGLGVRYLLKTLGQRGPQVTAAMFVYALTPYVLTLEARLSVILLPYTGLPWMLAFTVLALRRGGWKYPAMFALTVATVGTVNATALLLVGVAPVLWIFHELVIAREVTLKQALGTIWRIGLLTVGCSLWWISGLWAQGSYGIDILRFTETAKTVGTGSVSQEVLRGLGYWFFYGNDRYGAWVESSLTFTGNGFILFATYLLTGFGFIGATIARFRERAFFALMLVTGVFLAVGGHPWDHPPIAGKGIKIFLASSIGLSMRSLPRAVPLVSLAMAVFIGSGIAALFARRRRLGQYATVGMCALTVLALPPLWNGQMVDHNLDRGENIPKYWDQAAAYLDAQSHATRVWEVPGADFASYRWGNTVDPVLPGIMDRPYVARELIPYGSEQSADLLNASDRQLQEGVFDDTALAPLARIMGAGDINVRSDITYERYNTPKPRTLWKLLHNAPGIGTAVGFGGNAPNIPRPELPMINETELETPNSVPNPPKVGVLPVTSPEDIIRTASASRPVVMAADGEGIVDASAAGLLTGHELVLYSGSYADDHSGLQEQISRDASLVLTDTNRRRAMRWSTVRETNGYTELAGQKPMKYDPTDQRLNVFPTAGDGSRTVRVSEGQAWAEATDYGNPVTYTPEDQPAFAIDGGPDSQGTAWRTNGFSNAIGQKLRIHYKDPVTSDKLYLLQAQGGVRNRYITEVKVTFDGKDPVTVPLDKQSRTSKGEVLSLPKHTYKTLELEIANTDPGLQRRYDNMAAVGFAEVNPKPGAKDWPSGDDVIRLPVDLLGVAGTASDQNPLSILLTRMRTAGTNSVRSDEEQSMARIWDLPTSRQFSLSGQVRLSQSASDDLIDQALGIPDAAHGGVTATSSRRIPGGIQNTASAAIDGDKSTWWMPGYLDQHKDGVTYKVAKPVTIDHMDLTFINDGRHSLPRRLRIDVDNKFGPTVDLPKTPVATHAEPNATTTVHLTFPAQTGKKFSINIDKQHSSVKDVLTTDWYSGTKIVMPVGIVELGMPGLSVQRPTGAIDASCRTDLVTVNGKAVPVSLHGTVEQLLDDKPIDARPCNGSTLSLPAGDNELRTTPGYQTGFAVDQLVLRSAAGGKADPATGPLVSGDQAKSSRPPVKTVSETRDSTKLEVTDAKKGDWVVLGQSYNLGWKATANGKDLGQPTLVDGYANGWQLPADAAKVTVALTWTPQRVVWGSIILSIIAVLAALLLIWGPWRRRRRTEATDRLAYDAEPSMPRSFTWARVLRYAGPRPSLFATVLTVAGAFILGTVVIGIVPGVALAIVAAVALRFEKARPLVTLGAVGLWGVTCAYVLGTKVFRTLPPGFDWPTYFDPVHQVAWTAVALVVLDVVIDRCWLRRWWPTDDSPS